MNTSKYRKRLFMLMAFAVFGMNPTHSQEKKVAHTSNELYSEIAKMDSILFEAFNTQNMPKFNGMFTKDLEWFQDNGGLIPYTTIFENFANTFKKEQKLSRKLVKGSLEVHPLQGYGAIEIGIHEFRHIENGKEELGTFKFLMIWQKKDNQWKISRVVSYDH